MNVYSEMSWVFSSAVAPSVQNFSHFRTSFLHSYVMTRVLMTSLESACILPGSFGACVLSILWECEGGYTLLLSERL